jgi:hypothetical protein
MFEGSSHPLHSITRARDAMVTLDSIIRVLHLTEIDKEDPYVTTYSTRGGLPLPSSRFSLQNGLQDSPGRAYGFDVNAHRQLQALEESARNVPSLRLPPQHVHPHLAFNGIGAPGGTIAPPLHPSAAHPAAVHGHEPCACAHLSLGASSPLALEQTPLWLATARWSDDWSEAEVRKERCRRLCWSTLALAAGHTSVASAGAERELELGITDPTNVRLLYSLPFLGEGLTCDGIMR